MKAWRLPWPSYLPKGKSFVNFLQTSQPFSKPQLNYRPGGSNPGKADRNLPDSLFHKSHRNTGGKCKLSLFRILKVVQRITATHGLFIQERRLTFRDSRELWDVLPRPIPVSHESASYCCCNTLPHTWCLKTAQIYHLVFLQVRDLMWVSPADIQMVAELTALLSRFGTTCVLIAEASEGCPPPQISTPHPYRQQAV